LRFFLLQFYDNILIPVFPIPFQPLIPFLSQEVRERKTVARVKE
jgi:hypothetical protein